MVSITIDCEVCAKEIKLEDIKDHIHNEPVYDDEVETMFENVKGHCDEYIDKNASLDYDEMLFRRFFYANTKCKIKKLLDDFNRVVVLDSVKSLFHGYALKIDDQVVYNVCNAKHTLASI